MTSVILLIIICLIALGLLIFIVVNHRRNQAFEPDDEPQPVNKNIECCGAHEVCEAETLLAMSTDIIYYSDEELDAYRGIAPDAYTPEQIDEFREVLLTLQLHEVSGWLKSLQLRQIEIPTAIRDEALMIVEDFRRIRAENRAAKAEKE